eukprot:149288-Pyramimonas_sp.AAC.1
MWRKRRRRGRRRVHTLPSRERPTQGHRCAHRTRSDFSVCARTTLPLWKDAGASSSSCCSRLRRRMKR